MYLHEYSHLRIPTEFHAISFEKFHTNAFTNTVLHLETDRN